MKKIINFSKLTLFVLILFTTSCKKEFLPTPTKDDVVKKFKGLEVNHKNDLEALNYTIEDYQELYLNRYKSTARSNATLDDIDYPSVETLAQIEEEIIPNYPDVYEMSDEDIDRIKLDFPSLSDQEIAENLEVIAEYYDKNIQYDYFQELLDNLTQNTFENARLSGGYPGGMCSYEFWYIAGKPTAAYCINKAKNKALEMTNSQFSGQSKSQTKADAFRHGVWNVLIAKYYGTKKKSVTKGVNLAKGFTDRHELCNLDAGIKDWDCEMDYHNNYVGRDYFQKNSYIKTKKRKLWFKKKWLVSPSESVIKNAFKTKANNATKVGKSVNKVRQVSKYKLVYFEN